MMPAGLPRVARYTWARHWPASLLDGMSWGILSLTPFVVKRSLGGSPAAVPLLFALWQVPWILSPAVSPLLARANPQVAWRWLALIAFLPVLLVGLVYVEPTGPEGAGTGNLALFILLMCFHFGSAIAWTPHRGALLRTNYDASIRGRVFGLLIALFFLSTAVSAKGAGYLLDADPRWLRVLFPVAALVGAAGWLQASRIRWRGQRRKTRHHALGETPLAALRRAWREAARILVHDRPFRLYETGFMLYGFGFLCSVPVIVLFAEEELGLSYDAWTWAAGIAFPLAQIAASAAVGRLSDRLGIVRFTVLAFAGLGCFMAAMLFVQSAGALIAAYVLFGVAMAAVNMGWSLGPLHFAPDGEGHLYTSIHFSLVGVRSAIAPFLGYGVAAYFGYRTAFALSIVFLAAGAAVVLRVPRER